MGYSGTFQRILGGFKGFQWYFGGVSGVLMRIQGTSGAFDEFRHINRLQERFRIFSG